MLLDADGLALLRAIGQMPGAFPDIRDEASRIARALVIRQLKAKSFPLSGVRQVYDILGHATFTLVVDGLTEIEARALVARFDPRHPDGKTAPVHWLRRQIVALAGGAAPCSQGVPARAPRAPSRPKAPVLRALGSSAFGARWDGRDHDPPAGKGKRKAKG
ncbi:hypothetical protein PMNALOAF_3354 [Methylobacterium adhaesivum]|jgi:hypothetical protein|uniref:Uncharacterized protein n=1 Tax=Methylobacterium adhaesivum TaxID=333297 RepID=A0ABT8BI37_9HYPH|nr:hypothetical protein [Methylobacterium adhaesivum]MDN3591751.1 hypothetical protein [Methylobacterium adhaesivum]GJD32089.1 hypothetical protein PMNALOAF_3354 [Methylobacterium adhaesivum]